MLYKKNSSERLEPELFRDPSAEYRGTPFWAWNCKLNQDELLWQLDIFKQMGFGGAHIHVRTGLDTPYLSDEYMDIVSKCIDKAKENQMLIWLYDEDRWPSGAAGGLVTRNKQFRARHLLFTMKPYGSEGVIIDSASRATAVCGRTEKGNLLACYDVHLNQDGALIEYKRIDYEEDAIYEKWYAYLEENSETTWYNKQTYVNTLDKKAIDKFIEVTHERYYERFSHEFDNTIPAIFTDEPQFTYKSSLRRSTDKNDVILPWTDDLEDTYAHAYHGESILDAIPELIWERQDDKISHIRYRFHDHVCERFVQAYVDNCGQWCLEHQLQLTGHVMEEATLQSQTAALGEAMRCYRSFSLPGIDMLCSRMEYTTAKQAQSIVHQYGREAMTSELYGVTNWNYDFRSYKFHGDWQAALGVTIRVPHLAWASMEGEAKRDFPASIHYQSPWWKRFSMLENHFARINTALTRGQAIVNVGVIHPIESYWLHWGPMEQTAECRNDLEKKFNNLTEWLLFANIDFDFISESLIPELSEQGDHPCALGAMRYEVIVVPGCETLRSTTLTFLEEYINHGGKVLFLGDVPRLENAFPSDNIERLAVKSKCVPFVKEDVLAMLTQFRDVEISVLNMAEQPCYLYQMRQDKHGRWLFISRGKVPNDKKDSEQSVIKIDVKGSWNAMLYDTLTGEVKSMEHCVQNHITSIYAPVYNYDSLLIWLEPIPEEVKVSIPEEVSYTLSEPNVLVLDQAEYALDGGAWNEREEILRLDDICRKQLSWPSRKEHIVQPWTVMKEEIAHKVSLRFRICSEIDYIGAKLALENPKQVNILWNHMQVESQVEGWYVDKSIQTVCLPPIQKGINLLELTIPFGRHTNIENVYLLGDFGVHVDGREIRLIKSQEYLRFGDITTQGLPFYGGNITYHIPIETQGQQISVISDSYEGALQEIRIDDDEDRSITYPPYKSTFANVAQGAHTLHLTLYGSRINSFGPLHLADEKAFWIGPSAWRSVGDRWCYEYVLHKIGVMEQPSIKTIK